MKPTTVRILLVAFAFTALVSTTVAADLNVLFLGDQGHHRPHDRFAQLQPVLAKRGIQIRYTEQMGELTLENLRRHDALVLYANIDAIAPEHAKALLEYVAGGGGFVPLHCATYCFRNSKEVVALMGGQFKRHGVGVFRTKIEQVNHPIMKGFGGFESWDETYVHHLHNEENRTVLSYRVDNSGREPWTWIRTHGDGRVFYTAWGHDQRTWSNAGFLNLVERGIRWAAGDDPGLVPDYLNDAPFPVPKMTPQREDVKPFEFADVGAQIPNYTPGKSWGTQGAPKTKMQKPVPPEESLKHVVVPEGFRVELFAAEPDIGGKPICMAWDERGRLWVAETYDYPNELQPVGKGRDRIRILEDTDGDWRADKFTVFADKLSIPTSLTFHRGGVILQDGTRTLYLKDTNGDDVADERAVLFTGWSQGDTHGGVSNFQYGLDNWIWAMQGYNNSRPTVAGQTNQSFRQGFFRFRPDGSEVEFIRSTNNNTWGLGISEEGIIFGSTANRNPSVHMPIANRYYERVRGWTTSLMLGTIADSHLFKPITENVRQVDQHGGYTAAAGHALYTARKYPQEYWNRTAFVNGPTGHLVGTFVLRPDGSGFKSTSPFNLFASDDEWSAPIMSEVGPDGNVWVIDWYNYIVQHNPTPRGFKTGRGNAYETELRDKKHGRIYRVVYGATESPFSLADAGPERLLKTLSHPTMLWRKHAQRLLVERGELDVVPELIAMIKNQVTDGIELNVGAIHALWTLHGLNQLDGSNPQATAAAIAALGHRSPGVRRNAVQVLPTEPASTAALLDSGNIQHEDPQVRLATLLALSDLPSSQAAGMALLNEFRGSSLSDRWLYDAAVSAAATNADDFLNAVATLGSKPEGRLLDAVTIIANHYGRSGPVDTVGSVVAQLSKAPTSVADSVLVGIARGWPAENKPQLTPALEADLKALMGNLSPGSRGVLVKLALSWGSNQFENYAQEVTQSLLARLDDGQLKPEQRQAAAEQLIEFRSADAAIVGQLLKRVTPRTEPALALGIVRALQKSEAAEAGTVLVKNLSRLTPSARRAAIVVLLSRPQLTRALLAALNSGKIQLAELSLDQKQVLASHPDRKLREEAKQLLSRGGALPNADRQRVLEKLISVVKEEGDVKAGKVVFKKQCAKCHMHSGEGAKIGPDLTGMAVHPKSELLTHIIDPSRDVESNFRVYTVVTLDGVVLRGLLASESKTTIELFDVEGKKKVVLREDIDELVASTKSLMPEGFEKQASRTEIRDLLEFLTQRGKFLPLDLRKSATIVSDRGMFINRDATIERLIFPDWKPKVFKGVPFNVADPQNGKVPNVIMLHSPNGAVAAKMPKLAKIPCNGPARAIHLLSGVSGWGFPYARDKSVSMIVRLRYADGQVEDHPLQNAVHFADYIRRVDVPKSELAFMLRGQQIRYLALYPKRAVDIETIEFVKGPDATAPVVMGVTIETNAAPH